MTRKKLIAVLILVSLLVAIGIGAVFGPGWAKREALARLGDALGREVVAGDWELDLGWRPSLHIEDIRLANAAWSETPWMAEISAVELSIALKPLFSGRVIVPRLRLTDPRVLLERSAQGAANWQFGQASQPTEDGATAPFPTIEQLLVTDAELRYRDHARNTRLASKLERVDGRLTSDESVLTARGEVAGEALSLDLEAGALDALRANGPPFPVDATLTLGSLNAHLGGTIEQPLQPAGTALQLDIEGEGTPALAAALAPGLIPQLPGYRLSAAVNQDAPQSWRLSNLSLVLGGSELRGNAGLDLDGETPRFIADLVVPRVAIDELQGLADGVAAGSSPAEAEASAPAQLADLSALRRVNADVSVQVNEMHGVQVPIDSAALDLTLEKGRLRIKPLAVDVAGNKLALRGELDASSRPATGQMTLSAAGIDLSVLKDFGIEGAPPGSVAGEVTLRVAGELAMDDRALAVPSLGRIDLAPSTLSYDAPSLDTTIELSLRSERDESGPRLLVNAEGRLRGEALALDFAGDSPLALRDRTRPYRLDLSVDLADTALDVSGKLGQPLALQDLDLQLRVKGPNPARLTPVIGFPLPELPPYSLAGHVTRAGPALKVNDFDGRVGDSDLRGDLALELGGDLPVIYATLSSRRLDFDDLAGLIGGTPDAGAGETTTRAQAQANEAAEDDLGVLPSEPLNLDRAASAMNGAIEYRAERVDASGFPLDGVHFRFAVDDRQVKLEPLEFGLGDGDIRLELAMDARAEPFEGKVDGEVARLDLRDALAPLEVADESFGTVGGRFRFWVAGDSVADFFASADGGLLLVMTGGRLDALLVELAGLDVAESLTALLGDADAVPIDCAYIDLPAKNGVARIQTAVVDTSDTIFLADGSLDFRNQTLDIVLEPRPKDTSLFSARSAVHIVGPMGDPGFTPGEGLVARGVAAAALAAAAPVAGLIPLLDPSSGEDSPYCSGLAETIDHARRNR